MQILMKINCQGIDITEKGLSVLSVWDAPLTVLFTVFLLPAEHGDSPAYLLFLVVVVMIPIRVIPVRCIHFNRVESVENRTGKFR